MKKEKRLLNVIIIVTQLIFSINCECILQLWLYIFFLDIFGFVSNSWDEFPSVFPNFST